MKILQVHNRYRIAGGEDAVVEAERLALGAAGHEVELFENLNPEGSAAAALSLAQSPWNIGSRRRFAARCAELSPDVVHFHNTWFSLSGSVIGVPRSLGIPAVATLHNYRHLCLNSYLVRNDQACTACTSGLPWRGVVHGCYRDSRTQSAIAAVATSAHRLAKTWNRGLATVMVLTDFAAELAEAAGIDESKLVVRPNFARDPGKRPAAPSTSLDLLFVGRLSAEKGLESLLDAFELAATPLSLQIAGDGPLDDELRGRAVPNVHFLGRQTPEQIQQLMLSSRALMLPSICFEGLPLALVEAMAAGMPVLASSQPTFTQYTERQGQRWVVSPGDVRSWASALGSLTDDVAVDSAGRLARKVWENCFQPEQSIQHLVDVYESAIRSVGSARRTAT